MAAGADYGIDAPGVVRALALIGVALAALAVVLAIIAGDVLTLRIIAWLMAAGALACLIEAGWMIASSRRGKRRLCEDILQRLALSGRERVLDVGCGRGLVMITAAHRLPEGRAIGVDIWQKKDLSGNTRAATLANAAAEGVAGRVEVLDGDARQLPFPDGSFDAVLSSMALHNIPEPEGRARAIAEIARVTRPGGRIAIVDFQQTGAYVAALVDAGCMDVNRSGLDFRLFPPVRLVTARMP